MYEASCYFFYHAPQYMIEGLERLTMHTDYESTIRSLYMNIHIFSCDTGFNLLECDTKSCPELCNKRLYCVLHTNKG